jgi:uncharacterized protein YjiS (DUF1127 family)
MATTATNSSAGRTFSAAASQAFSALGRFMRSIAESSGRVAALNNRVRQAEALMAMSDEQLAQRGLRREEIVRHVFSNYWI